MESKLNFSAIDSYAKAYSAKICDQLFQNKEKVSGDDLLNLPLQQIGLFVLNSIYSTWQTESENLKSPYFNYEAEEVKAAMKKVMNVLSKNISIKRGNLEPLVEKATVDVVLLSISPYSYFKNLISEITEVSTFSETSRFIKINEGLAMEVEKSFVSNGHSTLTEQFDSIFSKIEFSPDDSKPIIEKLADVHPVKEPDFFLIMVAPEVEEDEEESKPETGDDNTLNDTFISTSHETVADQLKQSQPSGGSIKSMLSINQKFMFINDLFNDNQNDFNMVVDFIEGCETKEAAMSFIRNNYLKHNIWNPNAPQVREFLRLVDLQFE